MEQTKEQIAEIILAERERCMDIAKAFMNKYDNEYINAKAAGNSLAFVKQEMSEASRYIMNSISGRTGLNAGEPLINIILRGLN